MYPNWLFLFRDTKVCSLKAIFAFLRNLFQKYPKSFSLVEISVYAGVFVFYVWVVPFWFWGIYQLNIPFPEDLKILFLKLWHHTISAGLISLSLGLLFLLLSSFARRDSLKELGIRFDNIHKAGRECAITSLILIGLIAFVAISYLDQFHVGRFISYLTGFLKYISWGITQQFLLQSVILIRLRQIFGQKSIALFSTAVLFSIVHSPNVELMFLSFFFGLIVCILFLRNRNIITLGIMHGVLSMLFCSLLVPGLVKNYKVGPGRGNIEFVAYLSYNGGNVTAKASESVWVPMVATNKSTVSWDSKDKEHPVLISYHLFDAKGDLVEYNNVRTPFNRIIRTYDSALVDLKIDAPSKKGEYYVEVDIVKEKVTWFKNKGSKTVLIPLSVN